MFAQAQILKRKCSLTKDMKHDRPCDADTYRLRVQEGDLVLVMTDGKIALYPRDLRYSVQPLNPANCELAYC